MLLVLAIPLFPLDTAATLAAAADEFIARFVGFFLGFGGGRGGTLLLLLLGPVAVVRP